MAVAILHPGGDVFSKSEFASLNDAQTYGMCRSRYILIELNVWFVAYPLAIPELSHGPTAEVPFECVHHVFAYQSRLAPDRVAAITHGGEGESITYGKLDVISSRVARKFKSLGVKQGDRIILLSKFNFGITLAICRN